MSRHILAIAAALMVMVPAAAAEAPQQPADQTAAGILLSTDRTAALLNTLFTQKARIEVDLNSLSVMDVLGMLTNKYGVEFTIDGDAFKAANIPDIQEKHPSVHATSLKGLTLHELLVRILNSVGAMYLVMGWT